MRRRLWLALAVGATLVGTRARAGGVADDPDLRIVRQALAEPSERAPSLPVAPRSSVRHHKASAKSEDADKDKAERREVTIRYRDANHEAASVSVSVDLDKDDEDAAGWLSALAGSEVLSVEWDDGALAVSVK
jgi:hypothetical protein